MYGFRCNLWLGIVALLLSSGLYFPAPIAWGDEEPTKAAGADEHKTGEHGASGENEFDLSHANAGPQQGSIVEIKADTAIYSMIVFLLLLAIVTKFAWRPIMDGLNKRESSIAHMIDEAKENQAKAHQALLQYEARLAEAAEETRQMLVQARQDAEGAKEKIIAEAQAAAQRERDKSLAEIRAAKESALREMAQKSVDTAFALAGRVLHKEIRPADHSALIAESLAQFPSKN
jgi:F-type H+-transporting ATPase subunit b